MKMLNSCQIFLLINICPNGQVYFKLLNRILSRLFGTKLLTLLNYCIALSIHILIGNIIYFIIYTMYFLMHLYSIFFEISLHSRLYV